MKRQARKPMLKLFTFGGGSERYHDAVTRLVNQVRGFVQIDEVIGYTERDIPNRYYMIFKNFPERYQQGYGLWSWKPFLTHYLLSEDSLKDGDILIYADAGCELNAYGQATFNRYVSHTAKYSTLFFELEYPNRYWTKYHESFFQDPSHFFRNQVMATYFFIKKESRTVQFAKDWLDLCAKNDGELLKDPDDLAEQITGFREHRHDQSCLSKVVYEYNFELLPDPTNDNKKPSIETPILAMRNDSLHSRLGGLFFKHSDVGKLCRSVYRFSRKHVKR